MSAYTTFNLALVSVLVQFLAPDVKDIKSDPVLSNSLQLLHALP